MSYTTDQKPCRGATEHILHFRGAFGHGVQAAFAYQPSRTQPSTPTQVAHTHTHTHTHINSNNKATESRASTNHQTAQQPSDSFSATQNTHIAPLDTSAYAASSKFVAPSTRPTTLYRFEKKVTQSLSVDFSLSGRSCQSGLTSSGLVDVLPRAREASLPAKTVEGVGWLVGWLVGWRKKGGGGPTAVCAAWLVGFVACYVVDDALVGRVSRQGVRDLVVGLFTLMAT